MLLFGVAVYLHHFGIYEASTYGKRSTTREVTITSDFKISNVLDNTPFGEYYSPVARNPFIPVKERSTDTITDNGSRINTIDPSFNWPGTERQPVTINETTEVDVEITSLPNKHPDDEEPPTQINPVEQRKDKTIPVYLIGFAKASEETDKPRKAILANKKTGELYTLERGERLLSMTIMGITPYSVIIKMDDGRKVEFLNDILKETP